MAIAGRSIHCGGIPWVAVCIWSADWKKINIRVVGKLRIQPLNHTQIPTLRCHVHGVFAVVGDAFGVDVLRNFQVAINCRQE